MTAPPQTNAQGLDMSCINLTEDDFLKLLESDMQKVEKFTLTKVTELRDLIGRTEAKLNEAMVVSGKNSQPTLDPLSKSEITLMADEIATTFLRLEKYVNINFMGFHKILKKHDKNLPNTPCKAFYVNRLHTQAWVRGDYSDIVVRLSQIYAALRQDHIAEENKDASQVSTLIY